MYSLALGTVVAVSAIAQSPTVDDAHAFFKDLIALRTTIVMTAKWNENRLASYGGQGCSSTLVNESEAVTRAVQWAQVTSVSGADPSSGTYVTIVGPITWYKPESSDSGILPKLVLKLPDDVTAHRVKNAATLLMNSCAAKSKFD